MSESLAVGGPAKVTDTVAAGATTGTHEKARWVVFARIIDA